LFLELLLSNSSELGNYKVPFFDWVQNRDNISEGDCRQGLAGPCRPSLGHGCNRDGETVTQPCRAGKGPKVAPQFHGTEAPGPVGSPGGRGDSGSDFKLAAQRRRGPGPGPRPALAAAAAAAGGPAQAPSLGPRPQYRHVTAGRAGRPGSCLTGSEPRTRTLQLDSVSSESRSVPVVGRDSDLD
jgi:hypothetical protein